MKRSNRHALPALWIHAARRKAARPPSGPDWVHEIKHDGFRLLVRKEGSRVRCFTRGGHDWADRFPAFVEAAKRLRPQSFLIDGEAVICRPSGFTDFDALRVGRRTHEVTLAAFRATGKKPAGIKPAGQFSIAAAQLSCGPALKECRMQRLRKSNRGRSLDTSC